MSSTQGHLSIQDILVSTRELVPALRASAAEVEAGRKLPSSVLSSLDKTGVFRMAMPKAWGGPEADPFSQIEVIENLARGDASSAWCAMILSGSGFYASHLEDSVARRLYGKLDVRHAGSLRWSGKAEKVAGGYRVTGTWDFCSGCHHADYLATGCLVTENDSPVLNADGTPRTLWAVLPAGSFEVLDTWYTTGLAGSGSNDCSASNVFVPEEHTFNLVDRKRSEPLYSYAPLFLQTLVGVQLGIARHAIELALDLAQNKKVMPMGHSLGAEQSVQVAIAEAEGTLGSARSYVRDVVGELWDALQSGNGPSLKLRAKGMLMMIHAAQSTRRVVESMCDVAGATAIFAKHPIERLRRDIITANSHFLCQPNRYSIIGQALMGIEPAYPYF
ncbi:acyl-CoA dehydrogenase family protein [Sorangium sp. So ce362]|uniref:acyl-CoA dehydrogenase family protein n=1 Tax=Sorangium sp. So ce362 TaxID=3133303 RepID=UPI003F6404E8